MGLIVRLANGASQPSGLEQIAYQALAARDKMMQQDATAMDVDNFLGFCTDNLVYEDPVVHMRITGKAEIRTGMLGFLGSTRKVRRTVTTKIATANVVVLEQDVSFEENESNSWNPTRRHQVTILEFEDSKISRISDYWSRHHPPK